MPWYYLRHTLPPLNKELMGFKDGKRKKFLIEDDFALYGKLGKPLPELPEFWTYPEGSEKLKDPEPFKMSGIDKAIIQEMTEKVLPKIDPKGNPIESPDVMGPDGFMGQ
jgi:hypothetical protein